MTTYAIYAKPNDRNAEDAIFVPDAFCWGGFILTGFWVLWNRMWIVSSIVIAVLFLGTTLPTVLQFLVNVGVSVFLGLHGHDLLGWTLKRRGILGSWHQCGQHARGSGTALLCRGNEYSIIAFTVVQGI